MTKTYLVRFYTNRDVVTHDKRSWVLAYHSLLWAKRRMLDWERFGWQGADVIDATAHYITMWVVVAHVGMD